MPTVIAPARIKLRNILFATDLTPAADAALPYALGLAHHYAATMFLLHVPAHQPFVEATQPDPQQLRFLAEQKLSGLVRGSAFRDVEHKVLIQEGEVAAVVAKVVQTHDVDLIVIGTGGREGLGKLLLGSVAEEVFRNATCPVLTVGPHVTHGGSDGKLRHILFATDFGPGSIHAVPYALSLAEENQARLTLLHVSPEPGAVLPEPVPGALPVDDPNEVVAVNEQRLRALLPYTTELAHEPEYLVQFGPAAETIVRLSAQDVDMIVLGAKDPTPLTKHLGAGVAYRVVCEAFCPVLSVGSHFQIG